MDSDGDIDDVWGKLTDDSGGDDAGRDDDEIEVLDVGAPVRVTMLIRGGKIPVVPWAQGWRVGAIGPDADGDVTLICEHDIDVSPVAQLSAVTGLLGSVKQAQLDLAWWAIQTRAALPGEHPPEPSLEDELAELLEEERPDE